MASHPAVVRATLTAVEKFLDDKQFEAAGRELQQLVKAGAHEGPEKQRILRLCERVLKEGTMPLYGFHSLTLEV